MLEQGTGSPPNNLDFPRRDEEGAIYEFYNERQNRYVSGRNAELSPATGGHARRTVNPGLNSPGSEAFCTVPGTGNHGYASYHGTTRGARSAIIPTGRDVPITVPEDACLVSRERSENVARAENKGLVLYPCGVS